MGIDFNDGYCIIEIGCVELVECKLIGCNYYVYINFEWEVEVEVIMVYGIINEFFVDKLKFVEIVEEFFEFIKGVELVIYNVVFDIGYMDVEFVCLKLVCKMVDYCGVVDLLVIV